MAQIGADGRGIGSPESFRGAHGLPSPAQKQKLGRTKQRGGDRRPEVRGQTAEGRALDFRWSLWMIRAMAKCGKDGWCGNRPAAGGMVDDMVAARATERRRKRVSALEEGEGRTGEE